MFSSTSFRLWLHAKMKNKEETDIITVPRFEKLGVASRMDNPAHMRRMEAKKSMR